MALLKFLLKSLMIIIFYTVIGSAVGYLVTIVLFAVFGIDLLAGIVLIIIGICIILMFAWNPLGLYKKESK